MLHEVWRKSEFESRTTETGIILNKRNPIGKRLVALDLQIDIMRNSFQLTATSNLCVSHNIYVKIKISLQSLMLV